jgi:hypothetical protein
MEVPLTMRVDEIVTAVRPLAEEFLLSVCIVSHPWPLPQSAVAERREDFETRFR